MATGQYSCQCQSIPGLAGCLCYYMHVGTWLIVPNPPRRWSLNMQLLPLVGLSSLNKVYN